VLHCIRWVMEFDVDVAELFILPAPTLSISPSLSFSLAFSLSTSR